jgi:hypothetical protein
MNRHTVDVFAALAILFIAAKFTGMVDWPWWAILSPIWAPVVGAIALALTAALMLTTVWIITMLAGLVVDAIGTDLESPPASSNGVAIEFQGLYQYDESTGTFSPVTDDPVTSQKG